ncbi:DNA-binding protein [Methylobacterium sp. E-065]|uniref:DNA-binding protein n=1 Tax=Methylobacterium sp. E-065 TaxID=2836583 RepID=UPI001FB9E10F|nr:DNA-binding protein [Methylobacterium sp. E-065]MCJ2018023.1 DNA-binding protein [Methylobacterium sp. E-065]
MSQSAEAASRADDIEKVMTEAVIDPDTYGRIFGTGRGATYRALAAGVPVKPIRFGKTYRIPTAPIRALLQLERPDPVAA